MVQARGNTILDKGSSYEDGRERKSESHFS